MYMTQFTKGHKINLGKKHTEAEKTNFGNKIRDLWKTSEYREKVINGLKGKKKSPFTEEHKTNLALSHVGMHNSPDTEFKKGFEHTEEWKDLISKKLSGEKHWNWQGGISFEPYPITFNRILKN